VRLLMPGEALSFDAAHGDEAPARQVK
jgi:hypothetical protein